MDESLIGGVRSYINDILNCPQIDESRITVLSSMDELLANFKSNEFSEDDFYLLKGQYVFYPPETLEVKIDDEGNFLSIYDKYDEPVYISDLLGSKWSVIKMSGELLYHNPNLSIPTATYKSEISRSPILVENLLLTYALNYIPELTLVGIESSDSIREEERIFITDLKPN